MKAFEAYCGIIGLWLFLCDALAQPLPTGTDSFVFTEYAPLSNKPVKVYYHLPDGDTDSMPVLFVLHGEDRDAQAYLLPWINAANQYKFMVFSPEFSSTHFPGGAGYNLANIFTNGDNPTPNTLQPDSLWTFSLLDPLFLHIKSRTATTTPGYVAFGHSAGSQFLTRFALFKPQNLMLEAFCANAGWYTVPDASIQFPYGLNHSPADSVLTKQAFSNKLTVMLGKLDNNPNAPGLRRNPQADAQGLHRLARGRHFFTESHRIAEAMQTVFNWRLIEVEGVGHNQSAMAANALPLIQNALNIQNKAGKKVVLAYYNSNIQIKGLDAGKAFRLHVFNTNGQEVWTAAYTHQSNMLIPWKAPKPGVYFIRLEHENTQAAMLKVLSGISE